MSRNILNPQDLDPPLALIAREAEAEEIRAWLRSTARRWLLREGAPVQAHYLAIDGVRRLHDHRLSPVQLDDLPPWAVTELEGRGLIHTVQLNRPVRERLLHVVRWMNTLLDQPLLRRLKRIAVPEAERKALEWRERERKVQRVRMVQERETTLIHAFDDGWQLVSLTGPAALEIEGAVMRHCLGDGGYHHLVEDKLSWIWSLRDRRNEPHATLEIDPSSRMIRQCRGKANGPLKPDYAARLTQALPLHRIKTQIFDGSLGQLSWQGRHFQSLLVLLRRVPEARGPVAWGVVPEPDDQLAVANAIGAAPAEDLERILPLLLPEVPEPLRLEPGGQVEILDVLSLPMLTVRLPVGLLRICHRLRRRRGEGLNLLQRAAFHLIDLLTLDPAEAKPALYLVEPQRLAMRNVFFVPEDDVPFLGDHRLDAQFYLERAQLDFRPARRRHQQLLRQAIRNRCKAEGRANAVAQAAQGALQEALRRNGVW